MLLLLVLALAVCRRHSAAGAGMLDACVVHTFGCSCSVVCMRLRACSVLVSVCMLGFCMLHACFVHVFDMQAVVCMRLCACFVPVWCMPQSLASACFLLIGLFYACVWLFLLVLLMLLVHLPRMLARTRPCCLHALARGVLLVG